MSMALNVSVSRGGVMGLARLLSEDIDRFSLAVTKVFTEAGVESSLEKRFC